MSAYEEIRVLELATVQNLAVNDDTGFILKTMVRSEEVYFCRVLTPLVEIYLDRVVSSKKIPIEAAQEIFINAVSLLDVSRAFLSRLRPVLASRTPFHDLANAFLYSMADFTVYGKWLAGQDRAFITLKELIESNGRFGKVLDKAKDKAGVGIVTLLEIPGTRIQQYEYYIRILFSRMGGELAPLYRAAVSRFHELDIILEHEIMCQKGMLDCHALQTNFYRNAVMIEEPGRLMIRQGILDVVSHGRIFDKHEIYHVTLFTDMILIASKQGKPKRLVRLTGAKLSGCSDGFVLTTERGEVILTHKSPVERSAWISQVTECINNCEKYHATTGTISEELWESVVFRKVPRETYFGTESMKIDGMVPVDDLLEALRQAEDSGFHGDLITDDYKINPDLVDGLVGGVKKGINSLFKALGKGYFGFRKLFVSSSMEMASGKSMIMETKDMPSVMRPTAVQESPTQEGMITAEGSLGSEKAVLSHGHEMMLQEAMSLLKDGTSSSSAKIPQTAADFKAELIAAQPSGAPTRKEFGRVAALIAVPGLDYPAPELDPSSGGTTRFGAPLPPRSAAPGKPSGPYGSTPGPFGSSSSVKAPGPYGSFDPWTFGQAGHFPTPYAYPVPVPLAVPFPTAAGSPYSRPISNPSIPPPPASKSATSSVLPSSSSSAIDSWTQATGPYRASPASKASDSFRMPSSAPISGPSSQRVAGFSSLTASKVDDSRKYNYDFSVLFPAAPPVEKLAASSTSFPPPPPPALASKSGTSSTWTLDSTPSSRSLIAPKPITVVNPKTQSFDPDRAPQSSLGPFGVPPPEPLPSTHASYAHLTASVHVLATSGSATPTEVAPVPSKRPALLRHSSLTLEPLDDSSKGDYPFNSDDTFDPTKKGTPKSRTLPRTFKGGFARQFGPSADVAQG